MASGFQRYFVYAGFELNRGYIAKELCINRTRPWMHCNGRCYFMRKLKAAEENEKKQAEKDNLNRLEITFFREPFSFLFTRDVSDVSQDVRLVEYRAHYSNPYTQSLFRPPQA